MSVENVAGIGYELTFDGSKMMASINASCEKIRSKFTKSFADAGYSATSAIKSSNDEINQILNDTERNAKSKAASIAAIYRKQGDTQEEAFKKAWSHIERDSSDGSENVKKSMFGMSNNSQKAANDIKNNFANSFSAIAKTAAISFAAAFSVKKIVDFGKECLELGSDLQEVQNVVDTTFTSMSAKVDEFAQSAAGSFGLSETMAKKFTGTFGAMSKAFGFSEQEAYDMSTALTGLAGDVASFYNITQDEAYTKLKSVFTGETESLKDLGVVMTQTALDSYALANGFGKTTSAMTEAEKVALRYQFVQSQLSAASGDFAKTSGSWANQCRILSLQLESIMATIGQGLINLFTPVIRIINTVIGRIATLANAFKAFTELITGNKNSDSISNLDSTATATTDGLTSATGAADGLSDATSGVEEAAKKAAKRMRTLMGFDVIQKLPEQTEQSEGTSGNSNTSGTSGAAIDFGSLTEGEDVIEKTDQKMLGLIKRCKSLASLFKKGFRIGFGDSEKKIQSITTSIDNIGTSLKKIFTDESVITSANGLADSVALAFGKITGSFTSIGLSLVSNLFGGAEKYLQANEAYIRQKIVSVFDASSEIAELSGDFYVALADIFDIFSSDEAKGITADLIGIFSNGFLGVINFGTQFIRDLVSLVVTPVTENVDGIRLAFEGILTPIGTVLSVLHTAILTTFSVLDQTYTEHIQPFVTNLTSGISSIVKVFLDAWNTHISPVLAALGEKFETVWNEHIQPLINAAIILIGDLADLCSTVWKEIIQPIIEEFIKTSAPEIGKILSDIGERFIGLAGTIADCARGILTTLDGVVTFLTGVFSQDWDTVLQGVETITEGFKQIVDSIFEFIEESVLKPFDKFLTGVFETDWTNTFGDIGIAVNGFFTVMDTVWKDVKGILDGIITFLNNVFVGDWETAWLTARNAFKTIFGGLVNLIKKPVNGVISLLNGLIGAVNSLLALIESNLKFDFTIPNPVGNGNLVDYHWKATLPRITGSLPALAQGGFVEKNTPQLALIGDNRHQGEVVAPEDKLRQMAIDAVKAAGASSGITRAELESIIDNAVMRIIAALASVGFYLDGEQIATLQRIAQTGIDRRYNTTEII